MEKKTISYGALKKVLKPMELRSITGARGLNGSCYCEKGGDYPGVSCNTQNDGCDSLYPGEQCYCQAW